MNFATIAIIIFIITLTLYLSFLLLGVLGIAKNREAQELDKISNN